VLKSVFFAILAFVFIGCGGSNTNYNNINNGIISSEYNIGEANITKEGKIKKDIEVNLLSKDKKPILVLKVPKDTKLVDKNGEIAKNPKIKLTKRDSGENQIKIEDENGNKVIPTKPVEVKIKAPEEAKEGDSVEVDIPETQKEKKSNYFNKIKSFKVGKKGFISIELSPGIFKKFDIITIKVIGKEKKSNNNENNSTQTANRELNTTLNNEENQTEAQEQNATSSTATHEQPTQRRNQEQNTTSSSTPTQAQTVTHEQNQRRNQEQNRTSTTPTQTQTQTTTHEQNQRRNQEQNTTSSTTTHEQQTQRRNQEQNTTSSNTTHEQQTQRRNQEQNTTSSTTTHEQQTQRRNQEQNTTSTNPQETSQDQTQAQNQEETATTEEDTQTQNEQETPPEPKADTTPPTITLKGDNPLILEYGDKYKEAGFSATDDTDGNITNKVTVINDINISKLGEYKVIYSVKDSSNNETNISRVVKIIDTTPPAITLFGDNSIKLNIRSNYQEIGFEAIDNYDGNITNNVTITKDINSSKEGTYKVIYEVADSSGNKAKEEREVKIVDPYPYIPKDIDQYTAVRFLNKATFGANKESIKELKELGVIGWIDKQLSLPATKDIYLINMIKLSKLKHSHFDKTVEEYLEDNTIVFNRGSQRSRMSTWFQSAINAKDQLRHKLTYNLSQIIVESDFEPLFQVRAEVLARYFDILYNNAFSTYKDVLRDITFSSGMGIFLTYRGNRAEYNNTAGVPVYPDENYAREIMQLFSIGLNELNIDGTLEGGVAKPTYTQEDVNELARVFTGWDVPRNKWKFDGHTFGRKLFLFGDLIHPMVFFPDYHDTGEKKVLGHTIPAGMDGRDEILMVLDILMSNKNSAPFISKNLIMRFTKSNPSPEYVARVATVFKESGGDLKKVTKAILIDPEIWEDIKDKKVVKFKEPFVGFTNFLKAFNIRPLPYWYTTRPNSEANNTYIIHNYYNFDGGDLRSRISQAPGLAPNVFNFYDNDYIPNDTNFKDRSLVAPELQIQSDSQFINYSNYIKNMLTYWDKNYIINYSWPKDDGSRTFYNTVEDYIDAAKTNHMYQYNPLWYLPKAKFLLDTTEELEVMEMVIDGDTDGDFKNITKEHKTSPEAVEAVIKYLDMKLTGGRMNDEQFNAIYNNLKDISLYSDSRHTKRYRAVTEIIHPIIRAIVTSNLFMTE